MELNESFLQKVRRGEAKKLSANAGFTGSKGFSFDPNELTDRQKHEAQQRRQYEVEQGIVGLDVIDMDGADEEGSGSLKDKQSTLLSSGISEDVTISATTTTTTSSGGSGSGIVDALAQVKARLLAAQLGSSLKEDDVSSSSAIRVNDTEDELHINDYPATARRKALSKATTDMINERTGCNIVSKGQFISSDAKEKGNVKLAPGERELYVLIEGPGAMEVAQAKLELLRILNEETQKAAPLLNKSATQGRYSMI